MKVPTGLLGLIAILAVVYAASGLFRDYLVSNSTGKGPSCLEMLGKTTSEVEGLTYITGSLTWIGNEAQRTEDGRKSALKFGRSQ